MILLGENINVKESHHQNTKNSHFSFLAKCEYSNSGVFIFIAVIITQTKSMMSNSSKVVTNENGLKMNI